jgi:hypothetical protein
MKQRRGHENRCKGTADVRQEKRSPLVLAWFLHLVDGLSEADLGCFTEQGAYQFRKELPKQRLSGKLDRRNAIEPSPVRDSAARAQGK